MYSNSFFFCLCLSFFTQNNQQAIMVNWKNSKKFCDLAEQMPTLKTIIASTHELPKDSEIYRPLNSDKIQVVSFEEIIDMGKESKFEPNPPKVSSWHNIYYKFVRRIFLYHTSP